MVSESQLSSELLEYFNFSTSFESLRGKVFFTNIRFFGVSVSVSDCVWLSVFVLSFFVLSYEDDSSNELISLSVSLYIFKMYL